MTEAARAKISAAKKGKRFSQEHRDNLAASVKKSWSDPLVKAGRSGENHHFYGKHHSPELIEKMSTARKGKYTGEANHNYGKHLSDELKEKIGRANSGEKNWHYGKHWSPEAKARLSAAHKGKRKSPEAIENMRAAKKGTAAGENNPMYGKKHSPSTLQKIRNAVNERWSDPEYKAKVTAGQRRVDRRGEKASMYGKPATHSCGDWFTLPGGEKIWLRSSYEVRVVKALLNANIVWEYESRVFPLKGTGTTYCPDFYLSKYSLWWEIKGYWREDAYIKIKQFSEQYPEERIKILYKSDIEAFEKAVHLGRPFNILQFGEDASL